MIYVNITLASALNGRDAPDGAIIWQGGMKMNDVLVCDAVSGYWYKVRAVIRAGVNVSMPAVVWASAGASGGLQKRAAEFDIPSGKPSDLSFMIDGGETHASASFTLAAK